VTQDNVRDGISFAQPTTDADRCGAAAAFLQTADLPFPVVVDRVDDAVARAFGAWPDRIYVLDEDGVVVYRGGVGPFGFRPDEVRRFLGDRRNFATSVRP
jgi:hypothetical protein